MTPAQKGDLGENAFQRLCLQAGLSPTVPTPDRFGKDFLLEWPSPNTPTSAAPILDRLPTPLSCVVQVKATGIDGKTVRLSLAAALRLVHTPHPAFVAALRLDRLGIPEDLTLFEIRHDWTEKILTAVRKAQAECTSLSKRSVTFALARGNCVELSPTSLRIHLERAIGENLEAYIAAKKLERLSLGIDPNDQFSFDVTMSANSTDELLDAFMGEGEIECVSVKPYEKRFGIKLTDVPELTQMSSTGKATMRISPIPSGDWTLSVLNQDDEVIASVPGKAAGPGIPTERPEQFRALFENPFLTLRIKPSSFKATFAFSKLTDGPVDVAAAAQALNVYGSIPNASKVRLECSDKDGALDMDVTGLDQKLDQAGIDHSLKILKAVARLQDLASDKNAELSLGEITDFKSLFDIVGVFDREVAADGLCLTMDTTGHDHDTSIFDDMDELLVTGALALGDAIYAYAVRYTITVSPEGDVATIRSTSYTPLDLRRLSMADWVAEFEAFKQRQRHLTKLSFYLTFVQPPEETTNSTLPAH